MINGNTKFLATAGQHRPFIYMFLFILVASIESSFIYNQLCARACFCVCVCVCVCVCRKCR